MRRGGRIVFRTLGVILASWLAIPCGCPAAMPPGMSFAPVADVTGAYDVTWTSLGQTVYVPVYSHVSYRDSSRTINLAVTLNVRNTDDKRSIQVVSARYYDSDGALLKEYVRDPLVLGPMASAEFIIGDRDAVGGSGANFIVEWTAKEPVTPPVVETAMISVAGSQGISFVCEGRVLRDRISFEPSRMSPAQWP